MGGRETLWKHELFFLHQEKLNVNPPSFWIIIGARKQSRKYRHGVLGQWRVSSHRTRTAQNLHVKREHLFRKYFTTFTRDVRIYGSLFADGEMKLEVSLDSNVYRVGQPLSVTVTISSHPPRYFITTKYHETSQQISRRVSSVKVAVVQAVDVAMFASGSFKVFKTNKYIFWFLIFQFFFQICYFSFRLTSNM